MAVGSSSPACTTQLSLLRAPGALPSSRPLTPLRRRAAGRFQTGVGERAAPVRLWRHRCVRHDTARRSDRGCSSLHFVASTPRGTSRSGRTCNVTGLLPRPDSRTALPAATTSQDAQPPPICDSTSPLRWVAAATTSTIGHGLACPRQPAWSSSPPANPHLHCKSAVLPACRHRHRPPWQRD